MSMDEFKVISEIVSNLVLPAVAIMQVVNYVRSKRIEAKVEQVHLATNSLMTRQRVADHSAGERGEPLTC